jgi:serine/threonine protein kinase/tetratricopeptide (TPR) repeat protein
MSAPTDPTNPLGPASWAELEQILQRFENAWLRGERPVLDEYLPPGQGEHRAVLVELVHADLECRLKLGEEARVEAYLQHHPELAEDPGVVLDLLAAEYQLRRRRETTLTLDEYVERFPQFGPEVKRLLAESRPRAFGPSATSVGTLKAPSTPFPGGGNRRAGSPVVPFPAGEGRYRPLRFHARGGLGEVLLAEDAELHRAVALKRMQVLHGQDPESRRRFLLEAEITGRLEHPGIVPIYGLVQDADGQPAYAMRFIEGETLQDALKRFHAQDKAGRDPGERGLALRQLLGRFLVVCNTVAYAHSRGILHRDLKPANIMLGKYGETLVVDWGLAKPFDKKDTVPAADEDTLRPCSAGGDSNTQVGQTVGTPAYMSPEQAAGRWDLVGPGSDIYSLGATLYVVLTGEPPFPSLPLKDLMPRVQAGEFPPPRQRKKDLPRALEGVCLKAMAARPEDRYASALELAADVEHWLADEPVAAYREPARARLRRWARRHRAWVGAAAAALLASLVTVVVVFVLNAQSRREAVQLTADHARLALTHTFDAELARDDWSAGHLDKMDGIVADLHRLAPGEAADAKHRLDQHFAQSIAQSLDKDRLQPEDVSRIRASLDLLARRDPEQVPALEKKLKQRFRAWEPVFDLVAPFALQDLVWGTHRVRADGEKGDTLVLRDPAEGAVVATRVPCQGNVQLDATFPADAWGAASQLGLVLNYAPGHSQAVRGLAFAPDSQTLASAGLDGTVRLWDVARGAMKAAWDGKQGGVCCVAFAPGGKTLASGGANGTICLWDVEAGKRRFTLRGHKQPVYSLAFAPDGRTLASGSGDGTIKVWDAVRGKERKSLAGHQSHVWSLAFSPSPPGGGEGLGVRGQVLASGGEDRTVKLWDATTWKVRTTLKGDPGFVAAVAFTPDGKALATGSADSGIQLWDAATGEPQLAFQAHAGEIASLAFAPGGKTLATGLGSGAVKLWDVATGRVKTTLEGHGERVQALTFAPDGATLATAGADKMIKLWDTGTWKERKNLQARSYVLLLRAPHPSVPRGPAPRPAATPSLESVCKAGGVLRLEIRRNGVLLRDQPVRVGAGPLHLLANREGERLTFKINDLEPLVFHDMFPLGNTEPGVFGVVWPAGVRLERLRAWQQTPALVSSQLEKGDEYFARGQLARALACYQARAGGGTQGSQEARCKEAICLARLKRYAEAAERFEQIGDEAGPRWPVVALCQLWLLHLRQHHLNEANGILARLTAHYRFEELAVFIPDEDRVQILTAYRPRQSTYSLVHFDPRRVDNLRRVQAVQELFDASRPTRTQTKFCLLHAYFADKEEDLALSVAQDLIRDPWLLPQQRLAALGDLVWIQLRKNRSRAALTEVDRWLFPQTGVYDKEYLPLLLERARIFAARKEWDRAEKQVDAFFRQGAARQASIDQLLDAYLLKGFLREKRGDAAGARLIWKDGFFKVKKTEHLWTLDASMLGSLSGELTKEDARQTVDGVFATLAGNFPPFDLFKKQLFPLDEVYGTLREMWRTPRGRKYAWKITFRELSLVRALSIQVLLSVAEGIHQGAFPGKLTRDHDDLIWQLVEDLYAAHTSGKLKEADLFPMLPTWTGTTTLFGWSSVAKVMRSQPHIRGTLAYVYGHRYRRLNQPAQAIKFFRAALVDAPPRSKLARLAQAELDRKKGK